MMDYPEYEEIKPPSIFFPDGRVFEYRCVQGIEISEPFRIYRMCIELMEKQSQHLHNVEVMVYWRGIYPRPPFSGQAMFELVERALIPEMDNWRFPEGRWSIGTTHRYIIGKEPEGFM